MMNNSLSKIDQSESLTSSHTHQDYKLLQLQLFDQKMTTRISAYYEDFYIFHYHQYIIKLMNSNVCLIF